jgi:hypothetical protein
MDGVMHGQVLARFGRAVSDPTRVRLLLALRDGPGYPASLADLLDTTPAEPGRTTCPACAAAASGLSYGSAVLLVGLAANSLFGWAWADPIAALVIAGVAVREGRAAWRGDACCSVAAAPQSSAADDACACSPGCACWSPS